MSFKPRERVFLLAAVLAIAAAAMVWTLRSTGEPPEPAQEIQVVTAAGYIPKGATITTDKLKLRPFPEALPDTAEDTGSVIGKIAMSDIRAGDPIHLSGLASKDRLAYDVPKGMRAVTVGLDPVIGVAGFLKPRDHVDVIATVDMDSTSYTRTVLQNVELLAIGDQVPGGENLTGDKATAKSQPTATLAVTPGDADKLILADAKGSLRLALRSANDIAVRPMRPVSAQMVMGVPKSAQKSSAPGRPGGITPPTIPPLPPIFRTEDEQQTEKEAKNTGKTVIVVRGTEVSETVVPE